MFKRRKKVTSNKKKIPFLIRSSRENITIMEQFRTIRTNIYFTMIDRDLKSIAITSANRDAGKSFLAANLAAIFATENYRVLLVDTDLRKPTIHGMFGFSNTDGLTTLIKEPTTKLDDIVHEVDIEGLFLITSGVIPPNPSEMLASNRMTTLIEKMKTNFDLVIFDTPPILPVPDAQVMTNKVDGTIVIIPKNKVTKEEILKTRSRLKMAEANVIGAIFNRVETKDNDYYYSEEQS